VRLLVSVLVVAALAPAASAEPPRSKPAAPVDLALSTRGDSVTLTVTPSRAVPAFEVVLDGRRQTFAATKAGEARTFTVKVGRTGDVTAVARIGHRAKIASITVGTPPAKPAPPPTTTRTFRGRTIEAGR